MGKIIRNGIKYTSDGNTVSCELTWAEYNALSDDAKMNGTFYYITDIEPYNENNAPMGFTPIGTIISVMGNHAPFNYLKCDGSVYNIIDYPELANYFEIEFGSKNKFGGDGTTTFAVPDLQGEFLRGTGTNSHTKQGSGANVGEHQDGTTHTNIVSSNAGNAHLMGYGGAPTLANADSNVLVGKNWSRSEASVVSESNARAVTYTSRPTNTSVLYCIATKNIYLEPKNMYSTDEQVVGQWIDGKPLYQKTFENASLVNRTVLLPASLNVENVVESFGYITNGSTSKYTFPVRGVGSDTWGCFINYDGSRGWVIYSSGLDSYTGNITVRYTKTTD